MNFQKITIDDYEQYTPYYQLCMQLCAESSFLALWSYAEEMDIQRAFHRDLYWHKAIWREQKIWMTPIGEWDRPDWEELLTEVAPPGTVFGFIPELLANRWRSSFADRMEITEMRDEWDYVYHIDEQINLEGQAFSSMRGSCRRFMNNYPYEYSEICSQDIPILLDFQHQWMEWNKKEGKINEELLAEHRTVLKVLEHWNLLKKIHGAKLTVDDEIVAYIILEELDDYMVSGHILKGNYNFKGVYQAMQHLMYKNTLSGFSILNAWGDGGSAGLRQAKLNLNPIGYIRKYLVHWKG